MRRIAEKALEEGLFGHHLIILLPVHGIAIYIDAVFNGTLRNRVFGYPAPVAIHVEVVAGRYRPVLVGIQRVSGRGHGNVILTTRCQHLHHRQNGGQQPKISSSFHTF